MIARFYRTCGKVEKGVNFSDFQMTSVFYIFFYFHIFSTFRTPNFPINNGIFVVQVLSHLEPEFEHPWEIFPTDPSPRKIPRRETLDRRPSNPSSTRSFQEKPGFSLPKRPRKLFRQMHRIRRSTKLLKSFPPQHLAKPRFL